MASIDGAEMIGREDARKTNGTSTAAKPQIVVLTPVRNESWILGRFLAVTSSFADHIIIAYQQSSDDSLEICRQFPKVTIVENASPEFNEAERQLLLIDEARRLVPGPKILLGLDADDILSHPSISADGWRRMLAAAPGTVLHFRTVDLLPSTRDHIAYDQPAAIGYVDDGAEHLPREIHSARVPTPDHAEHLCLDDVCVVHYALTRLDACAAKLRYYSVLENILGTSHLVQRRRNYPADHDWTSPESIKAGGGTLEPTPAEWLGGWEAMDIDMRTVPTSDHYWHDLEVLRLLRKHGARRFWLDNIWDFDWQAVDESASQKRAPAPAIAPPPAVLRPLGRALDQLYEVYLRARAHLGRRR